MSNNESYRKLDSTPGPYPGNSPNMPYTAHQQERNYPNLHEQLPGSLQFGSHQPISPPYQPPADPKSGYGHSLTSALCSLKSRTSIYFTLFVLFTCVYLTLVINRVEMGYCSYYKATSCYIYGVGQMCCQPLVSSGLRCPTQIVEANYCQPIVELQDYAAMNWTLGGIIVTGILGCFWIVKFVRARREEIRLKKLENGGLIV